MAAQLAASQEGLSSVSKKPLLLELCRTEANRTCEQIIFFFGQ
jgi:hypothetical protein